MGLVGGGLFGVISFFYARDYFSPKKESGKESTLVDDSISVTFTNLSIAVNYGNGETRLVDWASITKVGITTTDEGPFCEDIFWGLHVGDEVAVVYPHAAKGCQELLVAMQKRLDNFDNGRLIDAMASSDNAQFSIWEKVT